MESNIRLSMSPSQVRGFKVEKNTTEATLQALGVFAMDELPAGLTTASVSSPIQFLQHIMPTAIYIATAARKIDELIGRNIVASWEMHEVITPVIERLGGARPYGDYTTTQMSSININYEKRTIARFEDGMQVSILEEERASKYKVNIAEEKRKAAIDALAIEMNRIGFFGYNDGTNRTYGFLNDPNLPSYKTVASGKSSSTEWKNKTFLEICSDIRTAFAELRVKSGDLFDPYNDESTLAISLSSVEYLSSVTELGISVRGWINSTYPKCKILSAPELDKANGGANIFYLYASKINDTNVFSQNVVTTLKTLGVERNIKGYAESYSNATAGVILNSPVGLVRYTGI